MSSPWAPIRWPTCRCWPGPSTSPVSGSQGAGSKVKNEDVSAAAMAADQPEQDRVPDTSAAPSHDDGHTETLAGRAALVTGGTRGIGLAIARRLLESGARV